MKVSDALESLRRFPQDADLTEDGRNVVVILWGYMTDEGRTPTYKLDTPSVELPWLNDPTWLETHAFKELGSDK